MERNETLIVGERSVLPFSRGILAQSLIVAGLEPQEAYRVAEEVHDLLERGKRYKERELAQIVARHLRRTRGADIARRYKRSLDRRLTPMVHKGSAAAPFSKMVLARSLRAAGVDAATPSPSPQKLKTTSAAHPHAPYPQADFAHSHPPFSKSALDSPMRSVISFGAA